MGTQVQATMAPDGFSDAAQQQLLALRARYHQTGDLFMAAEVARLQFVRWLYRTGQLIP